MAQALISRISDPMHFGRLWTVAKLVLASLLVLLVTAPDWPEFGDEQFGLRRIIGLREFDFLVWEVDALLSKGQAAAAGSHRYLEEGTRRQIVLEYLQLTQQSQAKEREIDQAFANPDSGDATTLTATMLGELETIRRRLESLQPLAEAIMEDQVSAVLREEGLTMAGQTFPPVLMHVTQTPSVLITSPRDRIEREHQIALESGLTTPDKDGIETAIFDDLDFSALVVPIGGAGSYPAMITETSSVSVIMAR